VTTGVAAICWLNAQAEISADVALRAGGDLSSRGHLVRVGQREAGGTVIEFAVGPSSDRVTGRARGGCSREARGNVIGNVTAQGLGASP